MKKLSVFILLFTLIFNLSAQNKTEEFTSSIETKHQKEMFMSKKYITYDIDIKFGGKTHLIGTIIQEPGGGKIKIIKKDGSVVLFDGTNVYGKGIPAKAKGGARFDIFTWVYFLGLPYKLNDKGTIWSDFSNQKWGNKKLNSGRLSFKSGTGDAPDDWYVVYKNEENILEGAAYIVSFGKGKKAAEKEPHAIKYNKYITINDIPVATNWTFHMWTLKDGYTDTIGEVQLKNIKFVEKADFAIPSGSEKIENPKF